MRTSHQNFVFLLFLNKVWTRKHLIYFNLPYHMVGLLARLEQQLPHSKSCCTVLHLDTAYSLYVCVCVWRVIRGKHTRWIVRVCKNAVLGVFKLGGSRLTYWDLDVSSFSQFASSSSCLIRFLPNLVRSMYGWMATKLMGLKFTRGHLGSQGSKTFTTYKKI